MGDFGGVGLSVWVWVLVWFTDIIEFGWKRYGLVSFRRRSSISTIDLGP